MCSAVSKPYKLSTALYGHSLDVRSLAVTPDNAIISGSRDKTAKLWRSNEGLNTGYVESMTYRDQKNFVAAVLYLEPTESYPDGLVVTGGNDNNILIYNANEPFASFTISEHRDSVCCLSLGLDRTQFLSGSWDKTAKLWSCTGRKQAMVTFAGHEAAVWSVIQTGNGNVVTASADKTIGIWTPDGRNIHKLTGHTDCVRALCDLPELERFVSVANDAVIKVWSYAGQNIDNYYGHSNYIYYISRNVADGVNSFVTCDENFSVMCWQDGVHVNTIKLPAQSIWSVVCLSNGDIVTGSSDGVVRVFTKDESRYASQSELTQFDEQIAAQLKQNSQEIGGYKVSDLPGREALYEPGKAAGQTKMIREGSAVIAYSWIEDADSGHWEKIGDVLGANQKDSEGKTLYEGKHYDFVFSVDVEDGKPPLKLPYNRGEDVYEAANRFISNNFLPAVYLDQVVDFIHTNIRTEVDAAPAAQYMDPFTGGSRYTPAASSSHRNDDSHGNADPLTGASSYSTMQTTPASRYFPHHKYLKFESGDPIIILKKLKEFNEKIGDGRHKVDEGQLDYLVQLCSGPCTDATVIDSVFTLLNWPQDVLFPVIDVLRLAMRHEENCNQLVVKDGEKLIEMFKNCINDAAVPNNTLLSFRTLCNLFNCQVGEELIGAHQLDLLENLSTLTAANKNIEIGMMTFLLNLTILVAKRSDEIGTLLLGAILPDTILNCKDPEAHFRGLVALGNILSMSNASEVNAKVSANKNFIATLKSFASGTSGNDLEIKRMNCSKQICNVLT